MKQPSVVSLRGSPHHAASVIDNSRARQWRFNSVSTKLHKHPKWLHQASPSTGWPENVEAATLAFSCPRPSIICPPMSLYCLRTRLVLLVTVALLPVFGLVIYNSMQRQQESLQQARLDMMTTVQLAALSYERSARGARHLLQAITSAPSSNATTWRAAPRSCKTCVPTFPSIPTWGWWT